MASSSHSSVAESLSVLCPSHDDSSDFSPASRDGVDEDSSAFWEKRRRTGEGGGGVRREREKRRAPDTSIDHRLLALSQENVRLKNELESRTAVDSLLVPPPRRANAFAELAALPSASATASMDTSASLYGGLPSVIRPAPSSSLPMLHLAQLQAAIQHQLQSSSLGGLPSFPAPLPSSHSLALPLFSASSSAFQPFHKDSVIKRSPERIVPDSSTDHVSLLPFSCDASSTSTYPISRQGSVSSQSSASGSLLGAMLSNRSCSPRVAQSSTEHWSRLGSPPRDLSSSSSKSDSESASSSLSPSGASSEDFALSQGLGVDAKRAYMDRRRRNNEAAKRCRANRRAVFEFRSNRVQILEGENEKLKNEIATLRREMAECRARLAERGGAMPVSVITGPLHSIDSTPEKP